MKHILGPNTRSTITGVQDGDSQPNALDLRLVKVLAIQSDVFVLSEEMKQHRTTVAVEPDSEGFFNLAPGSYEVVMENEIEVGSNEAGWVITRSTLNRNGVFITSGLYDSGYKGKIAGCMHVQCGLARIKKGARVAQYLSFDAESLSKYDGDYGSGKAHDQKYHA